MRHYVLPDHYDGSGYLELSVDESRYLTRVLRKRPGDSFDGVDPNGNRVSVTIRQAAADRCILEISHANAAEKPDGPQATGESAGSRLALTLFQCIPKANKMDLIVRQAVESGVERIVPIQSEHAVAKIDMNGFEKKRDRWLRIARQAMQQSGREIPPEITTPATVSQLPEIWREHSGQNGVCLFFHEKPVAAATLHSLLSSRPGTVGICIGPEGGFSRGEVENLLNSGVQPVYINTNVLRTETAALYAVAAVQTVILEKDTWSISQ